MIYKIQDLTIQAKSTLNCIKKIYMRSIPSNAEGTFLLTSLTTIIDC